MHVHPLGDPRRMLMLQFAGNFKDQILARGLLSAEGFAALRDALAADLRDPGTTVFLGPYIQAWGRTARNPD